MTKDGHDFAQRHGRIRLIECEEIKYLCKEHLDLDVLISLPKPPPKRRRPMCVNVRRLVSIVLLAEAVCSWGVLASPSNVEDDDHAGAVVN